MGNILREELIPMVQDIVKGKISSKKVSKKLDKIVQGRDPDDVFVYFNPPSAPGNKYTKDYLNRLEDLFYCGGVSREMIEHMSQVGDKVNHPIRTAARQHPAAAAGVGLGTAAGVGAGSYLLAKKLKKMRAKKKLDPFNSKPVGKE